MKSAAADLLTWIAGIVWGKSDQFAQSSIHLQCTKFSFGWGCGDWKSTSQLHSACLWSRIGLIQSAWIPHVTADYRRSCQFSTADHLAKAQIIQQRRTSARKDLVTMSRSTQPPSGQLSCLPSAWREMSCSYGYEVKA